MGWSYSPSDMDFKDKVRLMIGDTDENDQQLQDEEIEFFIETEGNYVRAAARSCETLAAKFARLTDQSVGQVKESLSALLEHYLKLADKYRKRAESGEGGLSAGAGALEPYAGGISVSDKDARESDEDRVEPAFTKDLHDNPEGEITTGHFDED